MIRYLNIAAFVLAAVASVLLAFFYLKKKYPACAGENRTEQTEDNIPARNATKTEIICFSAVFAVAAALIGFCRYSQIDGIPEYYKAVFVFCVTASIAVTDIRLRVIPNLFTLVLLGGGSVFLILEVLSGFAELKTVLLNNLAAAVIVLLILLALSAITKSGMGAGDIKYLSALCLVGGLNFFFISLMAALVLSLICGLALVAMKRKKIKDTLPFGPFILGGVIVGILFRLI